MIRVSKAHLMAAGESYLHHLRFATTVGVLAIGAGVACLIHGLVPGLCTGTASRTIRRLTAMLDERHLLAETRAEASELIAFILLLALASAVAAPLWLVRVEPIIRLTYTALAFAIPLTLLIVNRELESAPVPAPAATRR
jgi:hypothetical protein